MIIIRTVDDVLDLVELAREIEETEHLSWRDALQRAMDESPHVATVASRNDRYRPVAVNDPRLRWRIVEPSQRNGHGHR